MKKSEIKDLHRIADCGLEKRFSTEDKEFTESGTERLRVGSKIKITIMIKRDVRDASVCRGWLTRFGDRVITRAFELA